jgi:hypothetical protein
LNICLCCWATRLLEHCALQAAYAQLLHLHIKDRPRQSCTNGCTGLPLEPRSSCSIGFLNALCSAALQLQLIGWAWCKQQQEQLHPYEPHHINVIVHRDGAAAVESHLLLLVLHTCSVVTAQHFGMLFACSIWSAHMRPCSHICPVVAMRPVAESHYA